MKAAFLVFVLGSVSAFGQDAATMAAQQSMQASQQASQQAMQDMQTAAQANQQFTQQMIQNQQMIQSMTNTPSWPYFWPYVSNPVQPNFSIKSGKVKPGTKVHIKWRYSDNYAAIYYTTDGWTPTASSTLYRGPIPIDATTQLQAIAEGPDCSFSPIAHAEYTVTGPATPTPQLALSADRVLHAGTPLHLVTSSTVDSKTAQVGDGISILLDQDVKSGDAVVIPKGTPVAAVLTTAVSAARYNVPGNLSFEVISVNLQGMSIPVSGGETLEGEAGQKPKEAVIEPGMTFTVAVAADTPLKP